MTSLLSSCSLCQHPININAQQCSHCGANINQSEISLTLHGSTVAQNNVNLADTQFNNQDTVFQNVEQQPKSSQNAASASAEEHAQSSQANHTNMAHFKITDILGKGGMGAVYKAKDLTLERFVAIKMIQVSSAEQSLILKEAKTISQLNHPNIVTVYDIARGENTSENTNENTSDNSPHNNSANFIVMEWINGKPLNHHIPPQGFSVKNTLLYAQQIVAALVCAHKQHIIHRDIKPQNIMLDTQGHIKVLDFGIAALVNPKHHTSNQPSNNTPEPAALFGTPHYMSPEQIQGKATDERSDLFSLGIVLYEMLTGAKPFLGLNIEQISKAITQGNYTPITELRPTLKSETKYGLKAKLKAEPENTIIALIDKLLQTDPALRYQSAEQLLLDLNTLQQQLNQQKNWWQQQNTLTKTLIILPVALLLGWSINSVLFPPTTQELIQRQLVESKKVAFLPFDNISGDPVLQIFSDGVAAMLSSDLAEVGYQQGDGTSWVLPSSELSKLNPPSVENIYNKYGVDLIITGSIQHMGSTRNVNLSLINGSDGRQLKSIPLIIDAEKLFSAQAQIRQQVMELLNWQVPAELAEQFTKQKPEFDGAYKHYLEGQGYLYRYDHAGNTIKALTAFQKAIELDNKYENAYVGLAEARLRLFVETKEDNWLKSMERTVKKLKEINSKSNLSHYLSAEILVRKGNYQKAVQDFRLSIQRNPNHINSYLGLADCLFRLNLFEQAESTYISALKLSPNNALTIMKFANHNFKIGSYDKAITQFQELIRITPNNDIPYLNMAASYYSLGKIELAIELTTKALKLNSTASSYSNLGTMYFYQAKYKESVLAYEKAVELSKSNYIFWGNLGDAYRFYANKSYEHAYITAISLALKSLSLNNNNETVIADLSYYYANINRQEESLKYAIRIDKNSDATNHFMVATTYDIFDQKDKVLQHLNYAIEKKYPIAEILNSPLLTNIRKDNRFIALKNKDYFN